MAARDSRSQGKCQSETPSPPVGSEAQLSAAGSRNTPRMTSDDVLHNAYGIPTLTSLSKARKPPRDSRKSSSNSSNPRHGRSHSHPFVSIFSSKKKQDDISPSEPESTDDESVPSSSRSGVESTSPGKRPRVPDRELITGNCMTCASSMKWPKSLNVFRCSICQTINDLKPLDGQNPVSQAPELSSPSLLSNERTSKIIDKCIESFLMDYLRRDRADFTPQSFSNLSRDPASSGDPFISREKHLQPASSDGFSTKSPAVKIPDPSTIDRGKPFGVCDLPSVGNARLYSRSTPEAANAHTNTPLPDSSAQAAAPRRPAPFPPSHTSSSRYGGRSSIEEENVLQRKPDASRNLFRALEDYIVVSFQYRECINSSFATPGPMLPPRTSSGRLRPKMPDRSHRSEDLISTLDPKVLLLGDFAENGAWWGGHEAPAKSESQTEIRNGYPNDKINRAPAVVSLKQPRIDWQEVGQWYHLVLTAGEDWEMRLNRLQDHGDEDAQEDSTPTLDLAYLDIIFRDSLIQIQRVLLKATENLLKRPGAPLSNPDNIRFLLILLYNPLLHPSLGKNQKSQARTGSRPSQLVPRSQSRARLDVRSSSQSESLDLPRREDTRAPKFGGSSPGQHSGIVKRILGLLSNLDDKCHRYLASWFSRFSESHFRQAIELVGDFVTYRLTTRQQRRSREILVDPTAGLIPSLSSAGTSSSAAFHAALDSNGKRLKQDNKPKSTEYQNDWQIRAASRVMELLWRANSYTHVRQGGAAAPSFPQLSKEVTPAARKRAHHHGQILATSDFYNSLVDFTDIVADFIAWETKKAKFTFCQYPFFISIGTKIKILEYDARRQQDMKAREAFFDSILSYGSEINKHLKLQIRRECLVEDSLRGISAVVGAGGDEIKKGLKISFKGEEGVDAGGLKKEWFLLLVREVFDPNHGMFVYDDESNFCYFNPASFETSDQYFLVGVVLGLAIYNSTILDIALPPFAFRRLLAAGPASSGGSIARARSTMTYSLEDLEEFRPALARGLRQLLEYEGDVETTFCRDFVADVDRYGKLTQIPLCLDGDKKPVTNSNRREFVDLYIRYLLDGAVARQFEPFKRGFWQVCVGNAMSLFQAEEVELLLRGSDEALDVMSLKAVAINESLKFGNVKGHDLTIQWFWKAFETADPPNQRKLLSFITSSDRIPAMGTMGLIIKVVCSGDDEDRYPTARTCFNTILLPRYTSLEKLQEKLWQAVSYSEGFGLK